MNKSPQPKSHETLSQASPENRTNRSKTKEILMLRLEAYGILLLDGRRIPINGTIVIIKLILSLGLLLDFTTTTATSALALGPCAARRRLADLARGRGGRGSVASSFLGGGV